MTSPIFIDANPPIYAFGRQHALKRPSVQVLNLVAERPASFMSDAEVLQELLHRYLSLNAWTEGRRVFQGFASLMQGRLAPVHAADIERAAVLADQHSGLSARDLLHLAVMERLGCTAIVTADRGFDRVAWVERLDPADVEEWRHRIDA